VDLRVLSRSRPARAWSQRYARASGEALGWVRASARGSKSFSHFVSALAGTPRSKVCYHQGGLNGAYAAP
jgi:hypothetical protein